MSRRFQIYFKSKNYQNVKDSHIETLETICNSLNKYKNCGICDAEFAFRVKLRKNVKTEWVPKAGLCHFFSLRAQKAY